MTWEPITTVEELIARTEGSAFDYKTTYDLTTKATRYDIAKDVAAFANAYGGSIVVGIFEAQGGAVRLDGVDVPHKLKAEVATALQQHCVPVPSTPVDHEVLVSPTDAARLLAASGAPAPAEAVTLVTLNVEPDPRAPIGVRPFDSGTAGTLAHAYRFPLRVADQTRFMDPTELPMWMNSHERRIAIQLRGVRDRDVTVFHVQDTSAVPPSRFGSHFPGERVLVQRLKEMDLTVKIAEVDEQRLIVALEGRGLSRTNVPLAFVSAVWPEENGNKWSIALRGTIEIKRFVPHVGA